VISNRGNFDDLDYLQGHFNVKSHLKRLAVHCKTFQM